MLLASLTAVAQEQSSTSKNADKAAELYQLGMKYTGSDGITQPDLEKAFEYIRQAAEMGYAESQYTMGACYENGKMVEKDIKKAVEWYKKAAEQGNGHAQLHLAVCYKNGEGVEQSDQKAEEWLNASIEQEKIIEQEMYGKQSDLNVMDYHAIIRSYDEFEIKEFFNDAEKGDALAQLHAGVCYYYANDSEFPFYRNIKQDYNKAFYWFTKAAEQGNLYALTNLGVMYYKGEGTEQNTKKGIDYITKAAEQGLDYAQCFLGRLYFSGNIVKQDYKQAIQWFNKAAGQKYGYAYFQLAICYENGYGVEKDDKKAVEFYTKAVERHDYDAKTELAKHYLNGTGVEKDAKKATKLLSEAAEVIGSEANYILATCYENGTGVKKDMEKAIELYRNMSHKNKAYFKLNTVCKKWLEEKYIMIIRNIPKCIIFAIEKIIVK